MTETPPWVTSKGRNNNFNIMRLILASLVIYSHAYILVYGEVGYASEPFWAFSRGQISGGWLAVASFFILSGYLITQSWIYSKGLLDYMRKRILRIYPAFIVCGLFCFLIFAPLGAVDPLPTLQAFSPIQFVQDQLLLYLPHWYTFENNPVPWVLNGSAWTIRYEFWCYVLVAALGLLAILRRRFWATLFFGAWMMLLGLQVAGVIGPEYAFETSRSTYLFGNFVNYVELVTLFLAGSMFYLYQEHIPYSRRIFFGAIAALIVFSLLGVGLKLVYPIAGGYIFFYMGFHKRVQFHDFGRRRDLSYGVYLYAFPIQQLIVRFLGAEIAPVTLFLLALPPVFAFAMFSWYVIEKPALRLKNFQVSDVGLRWKTLRHRQVPSGQADQAKP